MPTNEREDHSSAARPSGYSLAGSGVAVETDDVSLLGWLDEFLTPGFEPFCADGDTPTVVVDSGTQSAAPPDSAERLGARPCFALDREVDEQQAYRCDGAVVVTDARYGTSYRIEPDVVRVLREDDAPRSRASVMRVVRELATAQALADGSRLQLHASALEHEGRVIVFAGPKQAGKTTLVTRLASLGGVAIAGNDRILLTPPRNDPRSWSVRQVPTVVSVRAGTRTELAGRFDDIPGVPSPAHLTLQELDLLAERHPPVAHEERLKLSPAQFARAAGSSLCGTGRLGAVFLISIDHELDGFTIDPCRSDSARASLDAVRYGSRRDGRPRTIFEEWLGAARPADADGVLLDQLASAVPLSTLRIGPSVLHDDRVATDLLECVLAS